MVAQHAGEEVAVDLVVTVDRCLDHGLQGELVDGSGLALAGLEDALDGVLGEQLRGDIRPLQVVPDVVAGVLDAEGAELLCEDDASDQRLEAGVTEQGEQGIGAGEQDAEGVLTIEFPHLLRLLEGVQFDTIYHEHFSYFSFATARRVLAEHGLGVFDVEELPIHGGSLRVYACHDGAGSAAVDAVLSKEAGLERLETYAAFAERVEAVKRQLRAFLTAARDRGESVIGYGAPAKGNTLLNFCGIGPDLVAYTVDRSPHKQGLLLPGSGIAVHHPRRIGETRPHWVLILAWNLAEEITGQMAHVRDWGGRFVVAIPELRIVP